jgi:GntR family transcriptional repressor for pyruvate dehydrogenase complex
MGATDEGASLSLSRVPRSSVAERVADQIVQQIRAQELAPGTRLPSERELMAGLEVGRSSVREAINGLATLGLVEIRHGQGVFVAERPREDAPPSLAAALAKGITRELFEARRIVEPYTARLAAERRTEVDVEELEAILSEHERHVAAGELGVAQSVAFHLRVAEAARNELLSGFVQSFSGQLAQRGPILEDLPGFREWEIGQHRSVFEPIAAGDPDLADARMLAHLDAVIGYHETIGFE